MRDGRSEPRSAGVGVVIPARNAAATIGAQLDTLARQESAPLFTVVVADNGSTDETADFVRRWNDDRLAVRLVDASQRDGASHARNIGVAALGNADLVLFCDADDEVDVRWVAAMVDALEDFDVVAGRAEAERLNSGPVVQWRPDRPDGLPEHEGFLPFAPSGNMGVRRSVWDALGGMAVEYPIGHDVEFSFRAQIAGYSIGFADAAIVHYRYRSDLWRAFVQAVRTGDASAQLYRDYATAGLPGRSLATTFRDWGWLPLRSPLLATRAGRGTWVRRFGHAVGRALGSAKHRTRYL